MKKPFFILLIIWICIIGSNTALEARLEQFTVTVDGITKGTLTGVYEKPPVYFYLKKIADIFKFKTTWDSANKKYSIKINGKVITLSSDSNRVIIQGKKENLSIPAKNINGNVIVPADFVIKILAKATDSKITLIEKSPAAITSKSAKKITDLRCRSYPKYTRVVIELSQEIDYRIMRNKLDEITVIFSGITIPANINIPKIDDSLIKSVSLKKDKKDIKVHVNLQSPNSDMKTLNLKDPPRIVLDLFKAPTKDETVKVIEKQPYLTQKVDYPKKDAITGSNLKLVVIDPGHGGHDPGARGPSGLEEKDVVLDVAKRLGKLFGIYTNVRVIYTREDDNFIPLKERAAIANRIKADLFVSIHANAAYRPDAYGAETFFLNSEASDNEARAIAAFENGVITLEQGNKEQEDVLKTTLWDLAQSEFLEESQALAEIIQDELEVKLRINNRGIKQAPFYVLGGATMPAILVEIGFISNPLEEKRLRDEYYRESIAEALYFGLMNYKKRFDIKMGGIKETSMK